VHTGTTASLLQRYFSPKEKQISISRIVGCTAVNQLIMVAEKRILSALTLNKSCAEDWPLG